jgi:predicted nucleic acid-binding protein
VKTYMTARVFVDTNILVYCYDRADPAKKTRAIETVDQVVKSRAGAISTQILAEFYTTVTRKLPEPLSSDDAWSRLKQFATIWNVLDLTPQVVLEAVRGVRERTLSYWDAQIWAVARLHRIPVILSEDFQHGSVLEGVRFLNPLRTETREQEWTELI